MVALAVLHPADLTRAPRPHLAGLHGALLLLSVAALARAAPAVSPTPPRSDARGIPSPHTLIQEDLPCSRPSTAGFACRNGLRLAAMRGTPCWPSPASPRLDRPTAARRAGQRRPRRRHRRPAGRRRVRRRRRLARRRRVNVPWATFEQQTGGSQQIFVRAFKTARGRPGLARSLNIDQSQEAEAPSIDFAGAGRTVPWVAWYEPNANLRGGDDEHLRQPLRRREQRLDPRGPGPRARPQDPVAEHPHRP